MQQPSLDMVELRERGWTDTLIRRFLGDPDEWESVSHWANFQGKRVYFLETVEAPEATSEWKEALDASIRRRRVSRKQVEAFEQAREATSGLVARWQESMTDEQRRVEIILRRASNVIQEARARGFRTPHKS